MPITMVSPKTKDEQPCREWMRQYMVPVKNLNHMHTSRELHQMMMADTGTQISDDDFKRIAIEEGFEPGNRSKPDWEFRISSAPLRRRVRAKANGWLISRKPDDLRRRG